MMTKKSHQKFWRIKYHFLGKVGNSRHLERYLTLGFLGFLLARDRSRVFHFFLSGNTGPNAVRRSIRRRGRRLSTRPHKPRIRARSVALQMRVKTSLRNAVVVFCVYICDRLWQKQAFGKKLVLQIFH